MWGTPKVVYLDTNALFGDHYWRSPGAQVLRMLADQKVVELWFSPVVVAERERQRQGALDEAIASAGAALRPLRGLPEGLPAVAAFDAYADAARAASVASAHAVYGEAWSTELPWPTPKAESLVRRELRLTAPFSPVGKAGEGEYAKGYRDTLIWLGLLDAMEAHPDRTFYLVSNDQAAFFDDGALRPDLTRELESRRIDSSHLEHFPSVIKFAQALEPMLKDTPVKDLTTVLAIMQWAEQESLEGLVGHYDMAHEIQTGLGLDVAEGVPIEGEYEQWAFYLDEVHPDEAVSGRWIATGDASFNGAVFKGDYYAADEEFINAEFVDEINDHYFLFSVEVSLEVTLEVEGQESGAPMVTAVDARVLGSPSLEDGDPMFMDDNNS